MAATGQQNQSRLPHLLLLTLWLALVSGLAEGGFRLFQKFVQGKLILMSPHVIWMAPVADLVWIGMPALLLLLARRVWPGRVSAGLVLGVLSAAALLPLVLLYTSMHKAVAVFLAAALGFQAARLLAPRLEGLSRVVRRTVVPLALLAAVGGVTIAGIRTYRERQTLAQAPAPRDGVPNVLLIIWDTVRGQSLSVYGYDRPTTPYLEQFAREGVRFDLAMSTAPWTLPAHGSMFTGHRPRDIMNSIFRPLVDSFPILAQVLTDQGYATGGFVANMAYTSREHGLGRGFARYEDYTISWGNVLLSSRLGFVLADQAWIRPLVGSWNQPARKDAALINQQFLGWAEGQDRPFFAFLNYFDAHRPYVSVEPYRSRFVRDSSGRYHPWLEHVEFKDLTEAEIRWANDEYDATIAYQDEQVRLLMEELQRRGQLENTLVIISSDHGEHFGDHRRMGHMNSLYRSLIQVPLLIRYPAGIPGGTVVRPPVSLRDIPQTVLDLAGLAGRDRFPGATLARFWDPAKADPNRAEEPVLSEIATRKNRGPYSLMQGDYHYIAWQGQDKPEELYHLANDPFEEGTVAAQPELADIIRSFHDWSYRLMGNQVFEKRNAPAAEADEGPLPQ